MKAPVCILLLTARMVVLLRGQCHLVFTRVSWSKLRCFVAQIHVHLVKFKVLYLRHSENFGLMLLRLNHSNSAMTAGLTEGVSLPLLVMLMEFSMVELKKKIVFC